MAALIKNLAKRLLFGGQELAQQVTIAIHEPQTEIAVWLHGAGPPRDVTQLHSIACATPFTVCIPFEKADPIKSRSFAKNTTLELRERSGTQRLLGKLTLRLNTTIPLDGSHFGLFEAIRCESYCMPKARFWAHYLQQRYWQWRDKTVPNVKMPTKDAHATMAMFICPRPVVLVTAMEQNSGNIFPMNLMGHLGEGYFSFALNSERQAAGCVKRAGRVALSSIPFEQASVVRQLGKHHLQSAIDFDHLPFPTKRSNGFGFPIPDFVSQVKEIEIQSVKDLGSHTFFMGKILHEETYTRTPQFFMVHGMYERLRAPAPQPETTRFPNEKRATPPGTPGSAARL